MEHDKLKKTISNNLIFYRKRHGLTQAQLAEKINYSDKAISKWERGESIPDVIVLNDLADIFGITIGDFTREEKSRRIRIFTRNKIVITLASVCFVWVIASMVYAWLRALKPGFDKSYYAFIYSLPISAIVLIVFSYMWKGRLVVFLSYSLLVWTLILSVVISLPISNKSGLFIIGVPLEILGGLWLLWKGKKKE